MNVPSGPIRRALKVEKAPLARLVEELGIEPSPALHELGLTSRVELATLSLGTPQTQPASATATLA